MGLIGQTIVEHDFFPDSPPSVVGELISGQTAYIELWEDGSPVTIETSGCNEIGSTGRYSWSTGSIPVLTASRQQFHWRMSGGGDTDEGDIVLVSREGRDGLMPSLDDKDSYIKRI